MRSDGEGTSDAGEAGVGSDARPSPLLTAVRLMYFGAALQFTGIFVAIGAVNSAAEDLRRESSVDGATDIEVATSGSVLVVILVSALLIAAWVWMARANYRGLGWARTTASVLAILGAIGCLFSALRTEDVISMVLNIAMAGAAIVATALLHHPASTEFYRRVQLSRR